MSTSSPAPRTAGPLRVLYAEDQEPLRTILAEGLRGVGYEVETASDGAEGWEKFSRGKFDLVITDLGMPTVDGIGFIQRIRETQRPTRIIVYSSSFTERSLGILHTLAVDATVGKETGWKVFCEIVAVVVGGRT